MELGGFTALKDRLTGLVNWKVDGEGRGYFRVDNSKVVNPDWEDGYWLLNGYDCKPLHIDELVEQDLGWVIEPVTADEQGDG